MPKYVLMRCPYDAYVWRSREISAEDVESDPDRAVNVVKTCPRCKKRFDTDWGQKPKVWVEKHSNYGALRERLEELNE